MIKNKIFKINFVTLTFLIISFLILTVNFMSKEYSTTAYACFNDVKITSNEVELSGNESLKNFLLDLGNCEVLYDDTFVNLTTLTFNGNTVLTNNIIDISGLELFTWTNLISISILNATNLQSVNLYGLSNNMPVFPSLTSISITGCDALTSVIIDENNNINSINLSENPLINNLILPNLSNCVSITLKNLNNLEDEIEIEDDFENLTVIDLANTSKITKVILKSASSLVTISLVNLTGLQNMQIDEPENLLNLTSTGNTHLLSFIVYNATKLSNINFDETNSNFKQINSEYLENFTLTSNNWFYKIKFLSDNLSILNLSNCENVTEIIFLDSLSNLSVLNLQGLYNLGSLDISTAINIIELNFCDCYLLPTTTYDDIENFTNLHYLNLENSSILNIDLQNFEYLVEIKLGNYNYLKTISIKNVPNLTSLGIENCNNLSSINLQDLESLSELLVKNLSNLENITINNCGVIELLLNDFEYLSTLHINSSALDILTLNELPALYNLDFSDCQNITELYVTECNAIDQTFSSNLTNLSFLKKLRIGFCDYIHYLEIENKSKLQLLDISDLSYLFSLNLDNLGESATNCIISLPEDLSNMKILKLTNISNVDFSSNSLEITDGMVNTIELNYANFEIVNLNGNEITAYSIINSNEIKYIDISNNNISSLQNIIATFDSCPNIEYINSHNNRIDMSDSATNLSYLNFQKRDYLYLGIQNIIDENIYNYEPEIYYGGKILNASIKIKLFKSAKIVTNIDMYNLLSNFTEITLKSNELMTLSTGTYVIAYYKKDSQNNYQLLSLGDDEYTSYESQVFYVEVEADYITTVLIVILIFVALIFAFIAVTIIHDKIILSKIGTAEDVEISDSDIQFDKKDMHANQRKERRKKVIEQKEEQKIQHDFEKEIIKAKIQEQRESKKLDLRNTKYKGNFNKKSNFLKSQDDNIVNGNSIQITENEVLLNNGGNSVTPKLPNISSKNLTVNKKLIKPIIENQNNNLNNISNKENDKIPKIENKPKLPPMPPKVIK